MKQLIIISLLITLPGCATLLFTAGAETAAVVAQERSVGEAVDDAGILLGIKDKYAHHPQYKELITGIDVKVVEGRVLLTGNVLTPELQIDAVKMAWQVTGVREIINEINITDKSGIWNYTRDVWVSTQVRTRLLFADGVKSVNFSIITVNQVVYVMGIAQNVTELNSVTDIASTTSYVQRVVSYVTLKSDPRRQNF